LCRGFRLARKKCEVKAINGLQNKLAFLGLSLVACGPREKQKNATRRKLENRVLGQIHDAVWWLYVGKRRGACALLLDVRAPVWDCLGMASSAPATTDGAPKQGHPSGLYVLFGAEAWERFSYYGMRALLVLYLTKAIGMNRPDALEIYGVYTGLVYITPLLGGFLADKFLGRRKAVLIGGIVMALGHVAMAFHSLLYVALALLIAGNGFFKPNISTMVGGLYSDSDNRRDSAFTIFYMGINLGAFWAPIACGGLGETIGWHFGFSAAALGMLFGLMQFGLGQSSLGTTGLPPGKHVEQKLPSDAAYRANDGAKPGVIGASKLDTADYRDVAIWSLVTCGIAWLGATFGPKLGFVMSLGGGMVKYGLLAGLFAALLFGLFNGATAAEAKRLAVIIILVIFNVFFWMGFEQAGGTMTLFAEEKTDLAASPAFMGIMTIVVAACTANFWNTTKDEPSGKVLWAVLSVMFVVLTVLMAGITVKCLITGTTYPIKASLFQAINPMIIVVLAPTFSKMWMWLDGTNYRLSIPAKMAVGMIVLGLGFGVLYVGQKIGITSGNKISPMWLVVVYIIHTLGELCLSPVGLSMVNKLAPARVSSLAMGAWLGSSAVANYLAATLEGSIEKYHIPLYGVLVGTSIVPAILLLLLTPGLKKWMADQAY
jgi:proton-dependent oligopeptide transporter, POT family